MPRHDVAPSPVAGSIHVETVLKGVDEGKPIEEVERAVGNQLDLIERRYGWARADEFTRWNFYSLSFSPERETAFSHWLHEHGRKRAIIIIRLFIAAVCLIAFIDIHEAQSASTERGGTCELSAQLAKSTTAETATFGTARGDSLLVLRSVTVGTLALLLVLLTYASALHTTRQHLQEAWVRLQSLRESERTSDWAERHERLQSRFAEAWERLSTIPSKADARRAFHAVLHSEFRHAVLSEESIAALFSQVWRAHSEHDQTRSSETSAVITKTASDEQKQAHTPEPRPEPEPLYMEFLALARLFDAATISHKDRKTGRSRKTLRAPHVFAQHLTRDWSKHMHASNKIALNTEACMAASYFVMAGLLILSKHIDKNEGPSLWLHMLVFTLGGISRMRLLNATVVGLLIILGYLCVGLAWGTDTHLQTVLLSARLFQVLVVSVIAAYWQEVLLRRNYMLSMGLFHHSIEESKRKARLRDAPNHKVVSGERGRSLMRELQAELDPGTLSFVSPTLEKKFMRGWYIIDFWPLEDSDKPELHREAWRSLLWASIFAVINQAIAVVGDRSTSVVLLRCAAVIPVFVGLLIGAWYDIRRLLQRARALGASPLNTEDIMRGYVSRWHDATTAAAVLQVIVEITAIALLPHDTAKLTADVYIGRVTTTLLVMQQCGLRIRYVRAAFLSAVLSAFLMFMSQIVGYGVTLENAAFIIIQGNVLGGLNNYQEELWRRVLFALKEERRRQYAQRHDVSTKLTRLMARLRGEPHLSRALTRECPHGTTDIPLVSALRAVTVLEPVVERDAWERMLSNIRSVGTKVQDIAGLNIETSATLTESQLFACVMQTMRSVTLEQYTRLAALRMPLDTTNVHVPDLDHWLSPEHRIFLTIAAERGLGGPMRQSVLDKGGLRELAHRLDYSPSCSGLRAILERLDNEHCAGDEDCGKYTWQQVRDVLVLPAVQAEETRMESVCAWFEVFDPDGDNSVPLDEFQDVLTMCGVPLSSDIAEHKDSVCKFVAQFDCNGDGCADYEEYMRVIFAGKDAGSASVLGSVDLSSAKDVHEALEMLEAKVQQFKSMSSRLHRQRTSKVISRASPRKSFKGFSAMDMELLFTGTWVWAQSAAYAGKLRGNAITAGCGGAHWVTSTRTLPVQGKYRIQYRVDSVAAGNISDIYVGVASRAANVEDQPCAKPLGCYYWLSHCSGRRTQLRANGITVQNGILQQANAGSIIELIVDQVAGCVEFRLNEAPLGTVTVNAEHRRDLTPVALVSKQESALTLVAVEAM